MPAWGRQVCGSPFCTAGLSVPSFLSREPFREPGFLPSIGSKDRKFIPKGFSFLRVLEQLSFCQLAPVGVAGLAPPAGEAFLGAWDLALPSTPAVGGHGAQWAGSGVEGSGPFLHRNLLSLEGRWEVCSLTFGRRLWVAARKESQPVAGSQGFSSQLCPVCVRFCGTADLPDGQPWQELKAVGTQQSQEKPAEPVAVLTF